MAIRSMPSRRFDTFASVEKKDKKGILVTQKMAVRSTPLRRIDNSASVEEKVKKEKRRKKKKER